MISDKCLLQLDEIFGGLLRGLSFSEAFPEDTYSLCGEDDDVIKQIEAGANSNVFLVNDVRTNQKMVLKATSDLETYKRELNALRQLSTHPHIAKLLGFTTINRHFCIYLEYFPYPTLRTFTRESYPSGFPENVALYIFSQLFNTIQYVHENHFSHHDFKTSNILIDPDTKRIKVIDFGLSVMVPWYGSRLVDHAYGTPIYSAPEVLMHKEHDPCISDIWSLGIVLLEMLTGNQPFNSAKTMDDLFRSIMGLNRSIMGMGMEMGINISSLSQISPETRLLLLKLLDIDPAKRIRIQQVQEYMEKINKIPEAG